MPPTHRAGDRWIGRLHAGIIAADAARRSVETVCRRPDRPREWREYAALIDFSTNESNGAGLTGCTIIDNLAGKRYNVNNFAVSIGDANDVRVTGSTVLNSTGTGSMFATDCGQSSPGLRSRAPTSPPSPSFVRRRCPVYAQITDNRLSGSMGSTRFILTTRTSASSPATKSTSTHAAADERQHVWHNRNVGERQLFHHRHAGPVHHHEQR